MNSSGEDDEERMVMLDAITTNETHFFREPSHFQFLEEQLLPAWRAKAEAGQRPHKVRAWSAGCSTGQEAYSLAMLLVDLLPVSKGWSIEIVATDLSRRALAVAEDGVWNAEKAAEIPRRAKPEFRERNRQPFGLYSEYFGIGTVYPFNDIPQSIYGGTISSRNGTLGRQIARA